MNPKAQRATSSSVRFSHVVQASRLRSFPIPAGGTHALSIRAAAPLSAISHQSSVLGRSAAPAFTLLEVLVASAIMGIVMFVLVSTANTSLQLWRGTTEKIAVNREGRTGMALLAWDLQNIIQPTNTALRPHINVQNISGNSATEPVLRFLTLKPTDYQQQPQDLGDVCYVEYRYTNNSLMRAFVGSADTFASLQVGEFPPVNDSDFQTLVPNVYACKFWGLQSVGSDVTYDNKGRQSLPAQSLRSIEYRIGVLDQKLMKLYKSGVQLVPKQLSESLRWYQAIQTVSPPVP